MRRALIASLVGLAVAASIGRAEPPQESGAPPAGSDPAGAPVGEKSWTVTGTVLETMDAAGYTYLRVDAGGEEIWAAAPQFGVAVGDSVTFPRGTPMVDYHSRTLDRSFDLVYFVEFVAVQGGSDGAPRQQRGHAGSGRGGGVEVDLSGIPRAEGGRTVGEIFAEKELLSGQQVVVRGRVVKFTSAIMGRNWIHLRDGTAGPGGADDLTITTTGDARVGNTVLVRGTLATDRDFGFGYEYDVIVENASITVE